MTNAESVLALCKLISDNTWQAVANKPLLSSDSMQKELHRENLNKNEK